MEKQKDHFKILYNQTRPMALSGVYRKFCVFLKISSDTIFENVLSTQHPTTVHKNYLFMKVMSV